MALPTFTNREYISAGVLNEWQRQLLNGCAWCAAPIGPFAMLPQGAYSDGNDGTYVSIWSGRLLYTGTSDTLRYSIYLIANSGISNANAKILVNGVEVKAVDDSTGHTQTGTVNISGLSLTAGTVYTVEVTAARSGTSATVNLTVDVYWLGLIYSPTYTAMTTWTTGNTVSITNIHKIRTNIEALLSGGPSMPVAPTVVAYRYDTPSTDDEIMVWRGQICHTHGFIRWRFIGRANSGKGRVTLYCNGTEVQTITQTNGETTHDNIWALDAGLTKGNYYQFEIRMARDGTSATDIYMECRVILVEEMSYQEPTATTPFAMGDTLTAANLNLFNTNINRFHPAAASPDAPGYYSQPAVLQGDDRRYTMQHRRAWLRYVYSGSGTTEITAFDESAPEASLPTSNTDYLMANASGIGLGSYYTVDDAYYAQEWDNAQT